MIRCDIVFELEREGQTTDIVMCKKEIFWGFGDDVNASKLGFACLYKSFVDVTGASMDLSAASSHGC
jgi:hypothetical protein